MLRLSTSALRSCTRARHRIPPASLHLYFVALIAVVTVYYLFLLSNGTLQILVPELLDKVFDNMLVHLLRGEFTVDRDAIDYEAITQEGKPTPISPCSPPSSGSWRCRPSTLHGQSRTGCLV